MHIKDFSKILIKKVLVFGVLIYMGAAGVFSSILHPTLEVCIYTHVHAIHETYDVNI